MASPSETPPIGSKVMDTRVLKEPRGFMRCLEWFFAILAFATCCDFSTVSEYTVMCSNPSQKNISVSHTISYPFRLDHDPGVNVTCGSVTKLEQLAGDFSSDAQFFVFTGVLSFLGTMACLVVYLFFPEMYYNENKKAPMFDFVFTVIVAVFWLSASAAWANGVIGMKYAANPENWIFTSTSSICKKADKKPISTAVNNCVAVSAGHFAKANVSIILGFLNFFLWASNLWFLYKETSWFSGPPAQTNDQTAASP